MSSQLLRHFLQSLQISDLIKPPLIIWLCMLANHVKLDKNSMKKPTSSMTEFTQVDEEAQRRISQAALLGRKSGQVHPAPLFKFSSHPGREGKKRSSKWDSNSNKPSSRPRSTGRSPPSPRPAESPSSTSQRRHSTARSSLRRHSPPWWRRSEPRPRTGDSSRNACEEYAEWLQNLGFRLLELLSLSLGLHAERLNKYFNDNTGYIRLNHYPSCPEPQLALGVGRHKDGGALTILSQDDVGGLDVKRKSDGEWVRVKPIPNSFIVNVGDIIQVWSNDEYESVEHRVSVNSERERFSFPFFFNPPFQTNIRPLEELTSEESPARYEEYNWGRFFKARRDSNFRKLNKENIQIYHFRKAL
ncbi:Gibberellin 20 oxidase 3 [Apostasia shenzhenica]|uniref:Gibberellin 20 oxidase 3 n=1 Tax=Apostasia shenzhenica TaxID=1088818 RepID=A0A2I0AFK2_9ASPA|nr:Gibberellin 20 oxidase 3 [Apostasia shenzhenica]